MRDLYKASSGEASYDSSDNYDRPPCHPRTREKYLLQLEEWSQENHSDCPRILWMRGPAGTGKSAIAQTFCKQLQPESRLGASLKRPSTPKLFPTLAYQLASAFPQFELAITSSIRENPGVFSKSLLIQLQKLIVIPCQAVTLAFPLVIVIDGLDECKDPEYQQEILLAFQNSYNDWKSHLAILVASRPEPDIERIFKESCLACAQTLEIQGSKDDVRTYLVDQFLRIRTTNEYLHVADISWPGDEIVEQFVERSSGHFVYASTVIKFIDDKDWNPEERVRVIRGIEREPVLATSPFSALDRLYTGILSDVPNRACLLRILAIIAAGLQLSPAHMGQLLELEPTNIRTTLRRLHSLINVPALVIDGLGRFQSASTSEETVTVHHASFLDFLNDPVRSAQFCFDRAARHSLVLHILKAFSEPSDIGTLPAVSHVLWYVSTYREVNVISIMMIGGLISSL
ncbi:NACHT domain-containing protein [Favolaschia claudopus]|uniref:NACHT domain-containing protein n=1 Tax=Favolaschia claudopus TaxID=2862362 RepID=A0AAW0A3I3_9AGAR